MPGNGVTTGNLNKAVNRNRQRFPTDFLFRLTQEEFAIRRRLAELERRAEDPAVR